MLASGGGEIVLLGQKIGVRNPQNPAILLTLLAAARLYFYAHSHSHAHAQVQSNHAYSWAFRGVLFFILVVLGVKTFIELVTLYHFHLVLDAEDWKHTYSTDLSFAFVGVVLIAILGGVAKYADRLTVLRAVANVTLLAIALISLGAGALYIFIGYTYFEWGSYIEPHHFQAMRMAGVGPEAADLILRWRTLVALLAIPLFWWLTSWVSRRLGGHRLKWLPVGALMVGLIPAIMTASVPISNPSKVSPSVQSPLMMLARPVPANTLGVDANALLHTFKVGVPAYQPDGYQKQNVIKARYQSLAGVAKGKSVVFVVMESVRRQNVELYGYDRQTMPTFTKLAEHGLVFERAYVVQPRSSKAMAALALGVTPDPRLQPISWHEERIKDKDNLFRRLIDDGRRMYIGTAQPYGGDNLQQFFNATASNRAEQVISFEDLEKNPELSNDDIGLSDHFANWTAESDQPFVGLLWTECAHIPYVAPITPFGSYHLQDKYDNCLSMVDAALKRLLERLEQQGQLDDTLLVVFGDHGEALGEKFDRGHGSYLYEHSMRIPMVIYNPQLFSERIDVDARFQLKDLSSTLLYLLGMPDQLNQSINIFSKGDQDDLYFSNVYQDFKLGFMQGQIKFVYRPRYDLTYIYDLEADPGENTNIANRYSRQALAKMKKRVLLWYRYHTRYIEQHYPHISG